MLLAESFSVVSTLFSSFFSLKTSKLWAHNAAISGGLFCNHLLYLSVTQLYSAPRGPSLCNNVMKLPRFAKFRKGEKAL